ncbi:FkbM family methyltransferase [Polyangium aurulentum]|uniref:FkbM family methyltransferase n=1 Tax=Polyangium aurulentum TaxID=2567896 RepID=UPI00146B43C5|nr:FkbM family methyltransferase [Polyangium aurulentum]UQA58558.1 FkbM family methyltransferase [Polyangium aurulentum]
MSLVRSITRLIPMDLPIAGRWRDRLFDALDPLCRWTAVGDAIETPWGALRIDADHAQERLLSYAFHNVLRHYESSELGRYIRRFARQGGTFVDVGANLGMYALVARAQGLVTVVVEPDPQHSAFLKRNEAVFGKVLAVAFSDEPGEMPLYYEEGNPGATSLFASPAYIKGEGKVPVRTFSAMAEQGEFGDESAIRLVKIDVEGFEEQAVAGMRAFLERGHRPHLWCEVRGDRSGRNGGSYRKVRAILSGLGYATRELKRGVDVPLDEAELSRRGVFDLLFTPR